jgi:long-chain fatty acid transport protein
MKKWFAPSLFFLALSVLFVPAQSFASGFALPEQGSAAMGMASAFVAQADDATAVWYNPAGITQLDGTRIAGGIVGIYPSFKHETVAGTVDAIERTVHLPFMLYATHKISDAVSFGLGINNPFGLETNWRPLSTTAFVATLSQVDTVNFNPNIALKLNDRLSFGFGVDYLMLDATLSSLLLDLTGDGNGWGANASVLYTATDKLNLGFAYRSKIKVDIDGTAFDLLPAATSITLPDEYKFGASYKTSDTLTLNAEADWTNWSTYDTLDVQLPTTMLIDPHFWQDTWCFRIGGQYKLSEQWKLRAGYLYDTNPVREEYFETRVPDSDRQGPTIGTGYTSGGITVDAAYLYLHFNKRTITDSIADGASQILNGNYKAQAHIASVTVGYKF